jgi:polysaccharide biosynthesis/export protein
MKKLNILRLGLVGATLVISVLVQAREVALGLVPLNVEQRYQAAKSAPTGQDAPLPVEIPKVPVTATAEIKSSGIEIRVESSKLEEKANEALNTVSLDERIQQQGLRTELVQFGYELFNKPAVTFSPAETLPVPGDYVVVPGDTFAVQVFGATDVQYRLVVTRDGRLLLPEVGAINVAGLTFEEAKMAIQSQIGKVRIGVQTVVTLADLQAIQIVVMGEVHKPGTFTVPGMTNLFNALVNTGGIKTSGSLRNVELRRQNQLVAKLDLYEMLLSGKGRNNPYLQQGDVIFVPTLGPTVTVAGEVNRPAIYELLRPVSVQSAINMAGGLLPTADPSKTQLRRLQGGKNYTLIQADLTQAGGGPLIANGDQIRVFPALNRMDNIVLLSGNVITPGAYQWKEGMRISDLVKDVQLLQQRTDFKAALLVRERRVSRRISVQYISLGQALEQPASAANIKLQPRDELIIFDTNSARDKALANTVQALRQQASVEEPAEVIEMRGYVKHPGIYPLEQGKRLLDLIRAAGGIQDGTDLSYAMLIRKANLSQRIEPIAISLEKALAKPLGDHNPILVAGDRLYLFDPKVDRPKLLADEIETLVRQSSYNEPAPIVQVTGKTRQVGQFPLTPGMTIKDLIDAAGGLSEDAYGQTAVLTREVQMADEYMRAQHTEVNLLGKNQVLPDAGMRLKARDRLSIREKPESENIAKWVTVKGEVRFPGKYSIAKRETLCELVRRVGGFTQDAYLFGTVFSRESVRKREQENIDKIFREFDTLLAELHTSPSFDNDKKLTTQKSANDTYQVIRQLKPPTAVGRMVIDMEKAGRQCIELADFVLEDGDQIEVPKLQEEVTVVGQVYHPMSHKYQKQRGAMDYINLSGGPKELAQREHAFVIQANGEVVSLRSSMSSWTWLSRPENISVSPGSTVVVPLTVDRINGREYTQSLIDTIFKAAVGMIGVKSLLGL